MKREQPVIVGAFDSSVYGALMVVPRGMVTTYGVLAAAVGCRSPRAVGQALRRNPFAPEVPCHRVVRGDGSPGGFQGSDDGAPKKSRLLHREGVAFDSDGRVKPEHIMRVLTASPSPHKSLRSPRARAGRSKD